MACAGRVRYRKGVGPWYPRYLQRWPTWVLALGEGPGAMSPGLRFRSRRL